MGSGLQDPNGEKMKKEDGTDKGIAIDEAEQLKSLMDYLKTPAGGVRLGGIKYTVPTSMAEEELGEGTCKWWIGAAPKKCVHIVTAGAQTLCGFCDEELLVNLVIPSVMWPRNRSFIQG